MDLDEIDEIADKLKVVITPMLESLPSTAASSSVNDLDILDEVSNHVKLSMGFNNCECDVAN